MLNKPVSAEFLFFFLFRVRVNWDDDISSLEGEEITVEIRERIPITTSISHNFVSI